MNSKNRRTRTMFSKAIREANKSTCNYRLGSVIIQRRKVLGVAYNSLKTHTLTNQEMRSSRTKGLHAEIAVCLKVARSQLEGADIYVVRVLKNGEMALARPCNICQSVLTRFGISRVFYSIDLNEYGVLELN